MTSEIMRLFLCANEFCVYYLPCSVEDIVYFNFVGNSPTTGIYAKSIEPHT